MSGAGGRAAALPVAPGRVVGGASAHASLARTCVGPVVDRVRKHGTPGADTTSCPPRLREALTGG